MKVITAPITAVEVSDEGLESMLGKRATFFCAVYIYTGDVVGVNTTCVKLENPQIVYETGAFSDAKWKDAQSLPNTIYLQTAMIESFGIVK